MTAAEILTLGHRRYELSRCCEATRGLAEGRAFVESVDATITKPSTGSGLEESYSIIMRARKCIDDGCARYVELLREHGINTGTTANDARNLVLELAAAAGATDD